MSTTPVPASPASTPAPARAPGIAAAARPMLPPEIEQVFLPAPPGSTVTRYVPRVLAAARVRYADAKLRVEHTRQAAALAPIGDGPIALSWEQAAPIEIDLDTLEREPAPGARFDDLPPAAARPKQYAAWGKDFVSLVAARDKIVLWRSPSLGETSTVGESERDFRARLVQAAREKRDALAAKLRQKYQPKLAALEERIRRAEQAVEREADQASARKLDAAISLGSTVLGAFLGRRSVSQTTLRGAAQTARGAGRVMKESRDVGRARQTMEAMVEQREALEAEFEAEVAALEASVDPTTELLDTVEVRPKKTQIATALVALAWVPDPETT